MKYTIEGFSQEYAMKLKKHIEKRNKIVEIKIDCTDLVILRWFVDFYPKMKKYIIDNKEYAWLTHNKLLEDLPLIDISRGAFIERMQKLVEFGILEYRFVKKGGTYSLYAFGKNYNNLIESKEGAGSNAYGVQAQTYTVVGVQTDNKNNSINDNSINNNIKESKKETFDDLINSFTENEEIRELLFEWLKVRKAKRAAMTNKAIELNLQKLNDFANQSNMSVVEYLKEIICRGWQAFYVINNYDSKKPKEKSMWEKLNEVFDGE